MIIKELILNNFVCYINDKQDPIRLQFSKGVNIFRGSNGGGKSHLFNAFYWVLFNEVYITGVGWEKGYPNSCIPDALKVSCNNNDTVNIGVTLKLDSIFHQNLHEIVEYTFHRTIQFIKNQNDFIISKNNELEISYLDSGLQTQFVNSLENDKVINIILPERLRKYMWFQGETIDDLIDFNNPTTLKQAVQTLSYYPIYLQLYRISELAHELILDKINSHDRASRNLTAKENENIRESELAHKNLKNNREKQEETIKYIEEAKEKVYEYSTKLSSFSAFPEIEKKVLAIEKEDDKVITEIENLENEAKINLVNLWMLKGTSKLIKDSIPILNKISKQIQVKSPSNNPIPLKVPGNIYIQKMLDDEICYICERKAFKETPEYEAISRRFNENEQIEAKYKEELKKSIYLEASYVDLANRPQDVLTTVSEISMNISSYRKRMSDLIQKRRTNRLNKIKIYEELKINDDDIKKISEGALTAKELTSKLIFYKDEQTKFKNKLIALKENEDGFMTAINNLKAERLRIKKKGDVPTEYEESEPYSDLLKHITKDLKEQAYEKLITEIEIESNYLYQEYLKANSAAKGKIIIDRNNSSVGIEDNGNLIILSQGLHTAAKMSVINAILSLSSKKIGKSYPLIADAPSSVFSAENTQTYTRKIGDTFEQVIIMSKDYSKDELDKLKKEKHISHIWLLENEKINKDSTDNSRANFKTFINQLK